MLHLDLFGPVNIMSISKKRYTLVIVDEYTRFTWVYFLHRKYETTTILLDHVRLIETDDLKVKVLRSYNGTKFKNLVLEEFCKYKGVSQQFSAPGTPQQNGVVERKNRTLIEAGRTMLEDAKLPTYFWAEAINTAYYTQNCTLINKHGKTPYEMVKGKKPNVKHLHVFGCKCFVLRIHPEQLGKFDTKADEEIFVGYPPARAYKIFNIGTRKVIESISVSFDDGKLKGLNEDDHERLSFENKDFESNADDSNPDESIPDDSNPDELNADDQEPIIIPDDTNPDRPNIDDPNPDNQEDSNATVEGEQ